MPKKQLANKLAKEKELARAEEIIKQQEAEEAEKARKEQVKLEQEKRKREETLFHILNHFVRDTKSRYLYQRLPAKLLLSMCSMRLIA